MPDVYEGDKPYIFVSYAHADDDAVLPLIDALAREGYRVWYDAGIELAEPWPKRIADRVFGCACFVQLISRASLGSDWCMDEVSFALDERKVILPIYLEDVELPRELRLRLSRRQALHRHKFATDEEFYAKLFEARKIEPCLTDEGRRRRGVKPRDPRTADVARPAGESQPPAVDIDKPQRPSQEPGPAKVVHVPAHLADRPAGGLARPRAGRRVTSVAPRAGIAEYSWAELKAIAGEIAAAGEGNWLALAKRYSLVDPDGRLAGDAKPLVLADGTESSVRICGFRHDELAGGGRAGITFEFADVPLRHRMNPTDTNRGGWEASEMRGWLNRDFLALLPPDLRAGIAEARKRTNNRGEVERKNDTSCVTATTDTLWLLSMPEVYGRLSSQQLNVPLSTATYDGEGSQYQLYRDKGLSTFSYSFAAKSGADSWWLRSPHAISSWSFHYVISGGDWSGGDAHDDLGVSPGFCF